MRKALVPESRFGRYFFYAIGEIVLVVIGILIALQVNNWNENKRNIALAEKHVITLRQNIKEDLNQLRNLNAVMDTIIIYSHHITDQFKTLAPVDDKTQLYMIYLILEQNLSPNKSGIQTLNNEGVITYLDDELQKYILDYYLLLDKIKDRENISNDFIRVKYESYLINSYSFIFNKENALIELNNFYKDDPRPTRKFDKNKLLADKKLEALIFGRLFQSKKQKALYTETIDLATKIINHKKSN